MSSVASSSGQCDSIDSGVCKEDVMSAILEGHLEDVPPPTTGMVKVYICSNKTGKL